MSSTMPYPRTLNREQLWAIGIIMLFHLAGLTGLGILSSRAMFLSFVPYHLCLMTMIIVFSHHGVNGAFLFFLGLIVTLGFGVEWTGVHTGWLFGRYSYGETLGVKMLGVPLTIGINWFLLVYSAGVLMQWSRVKNTFARIVCGALLLVLLDVLIEPVAIRLNYWHWANNLIPFKNYLCWFLISALLLVAFESFHFKKQSFVAPLFLATQFVFFAILYWLTG